MRRSSSFTPELNHDRHEQFQSITSCIERRIELPSPLARAAFLAQVEGHDFRTARTRLVTDDVQVEIGRDPLSPLLSQSATLRAGVASMASRFRPQRLVAHAVQSQPEPAIAFPYSGQPSAVRCRLGNSGRLGHRDVRLGPRTAPPIADSAGITSSDSRRPHTRRTEISVNAEHRAG